MRNKNANFALVAIVIFIIYTLLTYPETGGINQQFQVDNQFYALFLSICIFSFTIEKVLQHGLGAIIHTDVLLVQSFIYWSLLDLIQSRYALTDVSLYAVKYSFIYIAIFIAFIIIGANFSFKLPKITYEAATIDISKQALFSFFIFSFLVAMFYFWKSSYYDFEYMVSALTRSRFRSPWQRGVTGGFNAIIEHLKYFGYFLPSLAVLYWIKEKKINFNVILLFALAIFFSAFEFQGGGRRITGFLAGVAIITYLVYKRNNIKIADVFVLTLIGFGLLVLLDMQLAFRNKGYDDMFSKYDIENLNEVRVDDNFYRIAQLIDWIPIDYPHAGAQWLIYSFGRPIPRAIWTSKPVDPGYDVAKMANEPGVTLTTTIVGEAYASFGIIMIILMGLFYGALSNTIKKLLEINLGILGFALYSLGTLAIVGGVRALVDLIIFSYAFMGLIFLYNYFIKRQFKIFRTSKISSI